MADSAAKESPSLVSCAEIEKTAQLAYLKLDCPERFALHLSELLTLIEAIQQDDICNEPALSHPGGIALRLQPDNAVLDADAIDLLSLAPETAESFYVVPHVLGDSKQ